MWAESSSWRSSAIGLEVEKRSEQGQENLGRRLREAEEGGRETLGKEKENAEVEDGDGGVEERINIAKKMEMEMEILSGGEEVVRTDPEAWL